MLPAGSHRGRWIAAGLLLQIIGAGGPALIVLLRARHDVLGQISRSTIRLAWHEVLSSPADAALIAGGVVLFPSAPWPWPGRSQGGGRRSWSPCR